MRITRENHPLEPLHPLTCQKYKIPFKLAKIDNTANLCLFFTQK